MKKLFILVIIALLLPVFPAEAADCPSGCKYIDPKDRKGLPDCADGCYNNDGTRCCDAVAQISGGDCFIVTAAGQSRANLSELYWFRDEILSRTLGGRGLLFAYYDLGVGQKLAPVVGKDPRLSKVVRDATSLAAWAISKMH